jgi:hypothetical protein
MEHDVLAPIRCGFGQQRHVRGEYSPAVETVGYELPANAVGRELIERFAQASGLRPPWQPLRKPQVAVVVAHLVPKKVAVVQPNKEALMAVLLAGGGKKPGIVANAVASVGEGTA